jgi:hypothetical protein
MKDAIFYARFANHTFVDNPPDIIRRIAARSAKNIRSIIGLFR